MPPRPRPVDHQVGALCHLGHLGRPTAHQQAGQPSARSASTAAKAGRSPRSSPMNTTAEGVCSATSAHYGPLVTTGRSQLDHHAPGLHREAQLVGQRSQAGRHEIERGKRVGRATAHAQRSPALCPRRRRPPRPARRAAQAPWTAPPRRAGSSAGCGDPAAFPALQPVMAQHDEPVDVGEARVVDGDLGRSTGDHRDPAEAGRSRDKRRGTSGWARAASGSGTIGASVPSKSSPSSAAPGRSSSAARPARPASLDTGGRPILLSWGSWS